IMISPKQSAYYAAPSWPYYTLALALLCLPAVERLAAIAAARPATPRVAWWLRAACLTSIVALIALSPLFAGRYIRDGQLAAEVERFSRVAGDGTTIVAHRALKDEWSLQAYLYRL